MGKKKSKKQRQFLSLPLFLKMQLNLFFLIKHVKQRINATSYWAAWSVLHPQIYNVTEGRMQTRTINFTAWYTLS